jgi:hypothetical protein
MKVLMLSPVPTHTKIAGNRARILMLVDSSRAAGLTVHFAWAPAYISDLDDWYDVGLTPQLAALHAQHGFDALFVEYVFLSKALEAFPAGVVKILDTHDRFAGPHLNYLLAGRQPEWFATTPQGEVTGQALTVGHLLDMSQSVLLAVAPRAVFVTSGNKINVDGVNTFIAAVLTLAAMAEAMIRLLRDKALRMILVQNALNATRAWVPDQKVAQ